MKDPMQDAEVRSFTEPPEHGPGSGKEAWIAFARHAINVNAETWEIIHDQSAVIAELRAEIQLLREQIAARKPRGGRSRIGDDKRAAIEQALTEGRSTRAIGKQLGVSAMTVSRVRKRVEERQLKIP